jgi:hypothetical protein
MIKNAAKTYFKHYLSTCLERLCRTTKNLQDSWYSCLNWNLGLNEYKPEVRTTQLKRSVLRIGNVHELLRGKYSCNRLEN